MKLKLIAIIAVAAISVLARAQQSGPVPKPTKADAQNVVQIITSDKMKTQDYCDLTKLEGQGGCGKERYQDARSTQHTSRRTDRPIGGRQEMPTACKDEARRIAASIAKLPELLSRRQT